tara:strand:+ start:841 stop:1104 length:264 start_codon:yes stop_codon:yes gene_type:complete
MNKDELRRPDGQTASQGMDRGAKILGGAEYLVSNPFIGIGTIGLGYLGYKKRGIIGALVGAYIGFVVGFGITGQLERKRRREELESL